MTAKALAALCVSVGPFVSARERVRGARESPRCHPAPCSRGGGQWDRPSAKGSCPAAARGETEEQREAGRGGQRVLRGAGSNSGVPGAPASRGPAAGLAEHGAPASGARAPVPFPSEVPAQQGGTPRHRRSVALRETRSHVRFSKAEDTDKVTFPASRPPCHQRRGARRRSRTCRLGVPWTKPRPATSWRPLRTSVRRARGSPRRSEPAVPRRDFNGIKIRRLTLVRHVTACSLGPGPRG